MGLLGYYFAIFMLVLAAVTFLQFVYSEIKRRQARVQLTPEQVRQNAEAQVSVVNRLQQQHEAGAEEYKWEQERIRRQKREEGLRVLREAEERARSQASYRMLRGSPLYSTSTSSSTSSYAPSPAESAALSESRRLREEQDREYAMALQEDQQKEIERRRVQEQARQEELARAQRQAELEAKRARVAALREPDASCTEVAEIQIRLPDGSRVLRRYTPDAPLQDLLDLVDVTVPSLQNRFHLATTFPKRAYRDGQQTMADAGFVPNASLIVMQD